MQISDEHVEKYIALYVEEFGRPIDRATARAELTALVCLLQAVERHNSK